MKVKVNISDVRHLRRRTGAGIADCHTALEASGGNLEQAEAYLAKHGTLPDTTRKGADGFVAHYIHGEGRIAVLVELRSETDFTSRLFEFRDLAKKIAMHVASEDPPNLGVLLSQPYLHDPEVTVLEVVQRMAATTGENVHLRRFCRIGVDDFVGLTEGAEVQ